MEMLDKDGRLYRIIEMHMERIPGRLYPDVAGYGSAAELASAFAEGARPEQDAVSYGSVALVAADGGWDAYKADPALCSMERMGRADVADGGDLADRIVLADLATSDACREGVWDARVNEASAALGCAHAALEAEGSTLSPAAQRAAARIAGRLAADRDAMRDACRRAAASMASRTWRRELILERFEEMAARDPEGRDADPAERRLAALRLLAMRRTARETSRQLQLLVGDVRARRIAEDMDAAALAGLGIGDVCDLRGAGPMSEDRERHLRQAPADAPADGGREQLYATWGDVGAEQPCWVYLGLQEQGGHWPDEAESVWPYSAPVRSAESRQVEQSRAAERERAARAAQSRRQGRARDRR